MPPEDVVGDWTGRLPVEPAVTRRHRVQQGLWRSSAAHWPAGPPQNDRRVRARYSTLPNWLAEVHRGQGVQEVGLNLMSPEARRYANERLPVLERIDGKAETDRLWRNLLSSQPMAFSIAGHLHHHREDAATLMSALTDLQVASTARLDAGPAAWQDYGLDGIDAEWFPPRAEHTNDMSGSDIAACLLLTDDRRVLITIEVKYTDSFSPKPITWSRYAKHLSALGISESATQRLVKAGCSQVLRQVMITDSVRRQGLAAGRDGDGRVDDGLAVILAREDDSRARRVATTLDRAVGNIIPVRLWSHRQFFSEAQRIPGLRDWATAMTARYVPVDS